MAFTFDFLEEQTPSVNDQPCFVKPLPIAQIRAKGAPPLKDLTLSALDAICPLPVLAKASPLCGFYNSITDYDGVVRRVPLIITMDGKQYPSLALATLMKAMGRKNIIAKTSPIGIESIRVGKTTIPVDAKGQMLVRYRGGMEEFPYYSAKDILSGKVGEKRTQG